jgi:hypothetical protein
MLIYSDEKQARQHNEKGRRKRKRIRILLPVLYVTEAHLKIKY